MEENYHTGCSIASDANKMDSGSMVKNPCIPDFTLLYEFLGATIALFFYDWN